jgi:hypothetical protein
VMQNYVYTLGPTNALIVFDKTTGAKFKTFIDSNSKGGISIAIATSTAQPLLTSKSAQINNNIVIIAIIIIIIIYRNSHFRR